MGTIAFRGVTKRYDDGTEAVTNLTLDVADGELLILVGPSGCGKSTALRMVAGLEEITDGELTVDGEVVNDVPPRERDVAMVFQSYALYPHMTVGENMGFALRMARTPREDIRRRVEEAARVLDLVEHLDRKPANLSGGQRQRVAMGRAIVRDPRVFLMDEPLSNLDAKLRVQMRAEVARIQQQLGTTTLYVTHDQTEAMTLGDRVAVLRDGVLQQLGAPGELYNRPANLFVAGFIGSPAMSLLPARLDGEHLELPFGRAPLADEVRARLRPAPASPVVLAGLRPEHFEDAALTRGEPAALTLRVVPQVVEALGSESFVHFDLEGVPWTGALAAADQAIGLDDLPRHGDAIRRVVARVSAGSRARTGEPLELALRLDRVTLFDATTGASLLMP